MDRPRSRIERTPCRHHAHRPHEQITLQAGSDTKPRRTELAAYFRTADFASEPKAYRARNRKFEFSLRIPVIVIGHSGRR